MPPKESNVEDVPADTVLKLQDWLKLLSSRGVGMRVAMGLAAKMYSTHNTKERLSTLNAKNLTSVVPDKDARKSIVNAVKGIASGKKIPKKRNRDSDLLEPLQEDKDLASLPQSLEFNEIVDPEALIPVTLTVNRAPVKTAWVYAVALRMGFDNQEALSIAHVHVHLSSLNHALMLGNILNKEETRDAEEELGELPGEPWSGLKGKARENAGIQSRFFFPRCNPMADQLTYRIPVVERSDGTWRAIQRGVPVQPSAAYLYITRAFKTHTAHVMGAFKLLADSYPPDELNRLGLSMYENEFKPDVVEWGQRGVLDCRKILDQVKAPIIDKEKAKVKVAVHVQTEDLKPAKTDLIHGPGVSTVSDAAPQVPVEPDPAQGAEDERPAKKQMTVDEYEAMLEAEDAEGGFLEAGSIPT